MADDAKFHLKRARAIRAAVGNKPRPEPEGRPDVPSFAARAMITNHVRFQFHPLLLNAIGGPLIDGPKEIIGIEIRCPICKHIQPLGEPGVEHYCGEGGLNALGSRGCGLRYKYTAVKGNSWLWYWRAPRVADATPEVPVDNPKILLPWSSARPKTE